jgi:glycosyltransferase involved in cell wall biosynthesis
MLDLYLPANFFYPELPGGSLQYARYAPFLRERGVSITVVTPKRSHHAEDELEYNTVRILRQTLPPGLDALRQQMALVSAAGELALASGNRRVVMQPIGTFANDPNSLRQLWKWHRRGIPLARHFTQVPQPPTGSFLSITRARLRERIGFSPFSRLLMCSSEMGRAFQRASGISAKRIEVIPNGIDQTVFHPIEPAAKPTLRAALGLPGEGLLVLSVCSIIPRKGVDLLIAAWEDVLQHHPDATLVLVGSNTVRPTVGNPEARSNVADYLEAIRRSVAALSRPESVHFAGEVANVQDYYRAADLFAFASLQEGLPSAVMEAMSCGLPSVLAPFHGFPGPGEEYGYPERQFVPVSHDPASIAVGLRRLLDSAAERERIGADATKWIRDTQQMSHAADRLASIYESLLRK